jgi:HAD superfamily hydrolase (TIGR01549 family)
MNPPRAILFDLDGTLTDRRGSMRRFAVRFQSEFRLRPMPADALLGALIQADSDGGRPRREAMAELQRQLPWAVEPPIRRLTSFWNATFVSCTHATPELGVTLRKLRQLGIRLGVVSNGGARAQSRKIEVLGIGQLLDCVVTSQSVGLRKPDVRIFHRAIETLCVPMSRVWFLGDDPVADVAGARAAGLTAVWKATTRPWPPSVARPALQITRLSELVTLVRAKMCEPE